MQGLSHASQLPLAMVSLGVVAILAGIVGGGLSALGVSTPVIASRRRQVVLAGFGLILAIVGALISRGAPEVGAPQGRPPATKAALPSQVSTPAIKTEGDCSPVISGSQTGNVSVRC